MDSEGPLQTAGKHKLSLAITVSIFLEDMFSHGTSHMHLIDSFSIIYGERQMKRDSLDTRNSSRLACIPTYNNPKYWDR